MSVIHRKYMKQLLIPSLGGMIGLSSIVTSGGEHELGMEAYNNGQYSEAFRLIKLSAEDGSVDSQFILSTMYRHGLGIEADEYEGFFWCKKAAEEEHIEAQFQLGLMYLEGEGVTEDETEAQEWLWAAAEQGYPHATELLTYIYSNDYGIGC